MIKKFLVLFLIFIFANNFCFAELVVDDSIHSQIADKYNLEKLPDLPEELKNTTIEDIFTPNEFDTQPTSKYTPTQNSQSSEQTAAQKPQTTETQAQNNPSSQKTTEQKTQTVPAQKTEPVQNTISKPVSYDSSDAIKIKKGKKFKVVNMAPLSDSTKKGATVKFVSIQTETNKYITIPKGTVFYGTVTDSHTPNFGSNGGLLVIKVNSIVYKGKKYPIEAKITLANQKHIFFNNIKGKHLYWKNAKKSTVKGKKFYDKMWAKTKKYFKPGIEIIISPITFASGVVVYGVNIAASPVCAIFSKGGKLTIPQYSTFEIKMLEDGIINY